MKKESEESQPERTTEKDWFSVQEAAKYLGVSQPTIFRWMKQGMLSFYKVGNSTRFSREGLDAVIEKTTGQKEAEAVVSRCAVCGNHVLVSGQLQGTGRLYFRPDKTRFWVFSEGMVPTKARVCAACGYVQVHADIAKLHRLSPEAAAARAAEDDEGGETVGESTVE